MQSPMPTACKRTAPAECTSHSTSHCASQAATQADLTTPAAAVRRGATAWQ
jgi:hypothetical protein